MELHRGFFHMASNRLSNYLRTHRKRLGLSQEEVAHLLGAEGGAKVCRYEKFARMPGLETALACEIIFQKPVRELFAGLYQKVERKVAYQAAKQLRRNSDKHQTARARKLLEDLAAPADKKNES
jgi:transcriptional regulator with XRE-family HTH domain